MLALPEQCGTQHRSGTKLSSRPEPQLLLLLGGKRLMQPERDHLDAQPCRSIPGSAGCMPCFHHLRSVNDASSDDRDRSQGHPPIAAASFSSSNLVSERSPGRTQLSVKSTCVNPAFPTSEKVATHSAASASCTTIPSGLRAENGRSEAVTGQFAAISGMASLPRVSWRAREIKAALVVLHRSD